MQLSIFVATWGRTAMIRSRGVASFLDELSARGFAGVEATAEELGASLKERVEYCRLLQARGLRLIYAAYTSWLGYEGAHPGFTTPPEHLAALDAELAKAAELEAAAPGTLAHINIHGGCDSFDEAQADEYYSGALPRIDAFLATHAHLSTGARSGVSHESHRGRPLFHPTPTRRLLAKHGRDRLKLTLDVSHWHVSSERIVGFAPTTNRPDPEALGAANVEWGAAEAALAEAARREEEVPPGVAAERRWLHGEAYLAVEHVHARIGSGQSAQTPPGEDADWNAVRAHVAMWRTVWGNLSASGAREAIVTPEYGPGYFTGQSCVTKEWSPEALWAQTLAASAHLREEFAAWEAGRPPTGQGPSPALADLPAPPPPLPARVCTLPTIDVSRFVAGGAAERASLAEEWDAAFSGVGFCQLVGYESLLPASAIAALREAATVFFETESREAKMRSHIDGLLGYLAIGEENVAATVGAANRVADKVEGLNFSGYGSELNGSRGWRSRDPCEVPWLEEPFARALPERFRQAAAEYWKAATALMHVLLELSALALGLEASHFGPYYEPGCTLRLAYYPPGPGEEGQLRYGEHTDYEGFTILQRPVEGGGEGNGGLEVQDPRTGSWAGVPSLPDTLTINIGDLMARWTNDRWRATRHRVPAPTAGSAAAACGRLSLVYFTGPNPSMPVHCLPSAKCDCENPKYPSITLEENVQAKLLAAQRGAADGA